MLTLLYFAAALTLGIAVFHLFFWRLFRWNTELPKLKRVNRGAMQVFNLCITLLFFGLACILVVHGDALIGSALGRTLLALMAIFWLFRAALQPIFFGGWSRTTLGFMALLVTLSALHAVPLFAGRGA